MRELVLDSWPLIAWLKNQEPGASLADSILARALNREIRLLMSVVNLGEVYYSVAKTAGVATADLALETVLNHAIKIVSVSDEQVMRAARLKGLYPIAYGDAFAALLAIDRRIPVVTGDREFLKLASKGILSVEWVGGPVSQ